MEKTGNLVKYGDYETAKDLNMTDAEYKEWQDYKQSEKEKGYNVAYSNETIEVSTEDAARSKLFATGLTFLNQDNLDLDSYLNSESGKLLQGIIEKGGELYDNKDYAKEGENYPSQKSFDSKNPNTACTFTADYIAASLLTDNEMKSIDATAKLAEGKVTNSNMVVSDNNAVAKLSGATDVTIENTATYVDTGAKGQTKTNADATADMINTINNGGVLVARVGDTPGKPVGHSIVFSGYSVDSSGSVVINVIDPAGKYDHYDPETKKLYYIDENKVRQDDSRKMINYLHVTKK